MSRTKIVIKNSRRPKGYAVTANLTRNTHALIHQQAGLENRSASEIAEQLLREYVADRGTVIEAV